MMRWKRLIRCAGGLRCADVVLVNLDEVPPGSIVHIEYTCAACGTHYAFDSRTGKRRIIDRPTLPGAPVELEPGQTLKFTPFDPSRN